MVNSDKSTETPAPLPLHLFYVIKYEMNLLGSCRFIPLY